MTIAQMMVLLLIMTFYCMVPTALLVKRFHCVEKLSVCLTLFSNNLLFLLCFIVCHAELNAILNKNTADIKGCTIYVVLFPCNECAKLIIQSGIVTVLYVSDKYHDNVEIVASRKLLDMAGVKYRYL